MIWKGDGLLRILAGNHPLIRLGHRIVVLRCHCNRQNTLINVVACFPESVARPSADDPNDLLKETMLEVFKEFSPHVQALMRLADKVMVWCIPNPALSFACHARVGDVDDFGCRYGDCSTSLLSILGLAAMRHSLGMPHTHCYHMRRKVVRRRLKSMSPSLPILPPAPK